MTIMKDVHRLLEYGLSRGLLEEEDRWFAMNALLEVLDLSGPEAMEEGFFPAEPIAELLERMRAYAVQAGLVENDSNELLDLFDTRVMGTLLERPAAFRRRFFAHYARSPEAATAFYYRHAIDSNYIRAERIAKDIRWSHKTSYGHIDMTINLSKPEKDPRNIARPTEHSTVKYPLCMICKENEGYAGRIGHPARQNLRVIPLELAGESWYMQYSPYVYYDEHCIVFSEAHTPMRITGTTIRRLLDFVQQFPHYVIGSNADLPIVGGSILSHDHFQGGHYDFPMAQAAEEGVMEREGLTLATLDWPMSVIRLKSTSIQRLVEASTTLLERWKAYSDPTVELISHTGEVEHNTITPIARYREGRYEVDLILRNNRTDDVHPHGIFHSHAKYHHIKWENIGLIECMGLAILPGRLKQEMNEVKKHLLSGAVEKIFEEETLRKHGDFAKEIFGKHPRIGVENIDEIFEKEIGEVFSNVLQNCGVFKRNPPGQSAMKRCCEVLYEGL